jgi:hypothetical protein
MRESARRLLLLCAAVSILLAPVRLYAADPVPEEYKTEEFEPWMWKLRRFEIVAFGSLPFTLTLVSLGYGGVRFLSHLGEGAATAATYLPWPYPVSSHVPYTAAENVGVGLGIVACSLAVSLVDLLIGEIRERRAEGR